MGLNWKKINKGPNWIKATKIWTKIIIKPKIYVSGRYSFKSCF